MKIALIGYGKMGKEIEQILISRGHTVTLIIDIDNAGDLNAENLRKVMSLSNSPLPIPLFRTS